MTEITGSNFMGLLTAIYGVFYHGAKEEIARYGFC